MLAIVIPYYKITFFEDTLESLAHQTDKRFKVYIGDDASPEKPLDLLDKYKGQFDFIYQRFETNLGGNALTKQWERCIQLSGEEEWIMILGDDDILGSDVVASFYHHYEEFNQQCNVGRFATVVLNEQEDTVSKVYEHPKLEKGMDFFIRKLKWETRSSLSEYFFKRAVYLKYYFKEYPSGFYSDDRAWIDFSEDKPIYTINKSIIKIRISDQSLSGTADKEVLRQAEFLYLKYFYDRKMSCLSKKNRIFILKKIEFYYNYSKIFNLISWFHLYVKYWFNFDFRELYRFHKRILLKS